MDKNEFLNILREALQDEMPPEKVEENIRYYNDYISSKGDEYQQESEIASIGNPRLIAQTIIDSYKMSGEYKYTGQANGNNYSTHTAGSQNRNAAANDTKPPSTENELWSKIKRAVTITVVVVVILFVLSFLARAFIYVGIPIIICCLLIKILTSLFKK